MQENKLILTPQEREILAGIASCVDRRVRTTRRNFQITFAPSADSEEILTTGRYMVRAPFDGREILQRRLTGAERKAFQRRVDKLEFHGLVVADRGPCDARRMTIALTKAGCEAIGLDPSQYEGTLGENTLKRLRSEWNWRSK